MVINKVIMYVCMYMYVIVKNTILKTLTWQDGSVKAFASNPHNLSPIPRTHTVGENQHLQILL